MDPLYFKDCALLPSSGDNAAIATRDIPAGSTLLLDRNEMAVPFTVLEGHRFAVRTLRQGELLLSWGLPFGRTLREIPAGEYLANSKMLGALTQRQLSITLPARPNFEDYRLPLSISEEQFSPCEQVPLHANRGTFQGYLRVGRGVGTRNYVLLLGTSGHTGPFVTTLAAQLQNLLPGYPQVTGIVPVAHTEGAGPFPGNNHSLVLRTLAGFVLNPNVAAVLAVDLGGEPINNRALQAALEAHPLGKYRPEMRYFSRSGSFAQAAAQALPLVRELLEIANGCTRTIQPLAGLKVGLQCGGSDAFSGVSGNPLLGWMSRELVSHGGSASLAETDELIGAESYVLARVRNDEVAKEFLRKIDRFQEIAGWHGHSAEGNPSGGNMLRGLYNIAIKSIGAAMKKAPDVRIDFVTEYGEAMIDPGFYFMDSPGNDLESIAGQVAAGCNMILFATGNGSITNFPFVPTIKVMTTTRRFQLLSRDMDFNAGRYQDGESFEKLGLEAFNYMVDVAGGKLSVGEKAKHSQVQIWREWRQRGQPAQLNLTEPDGKPIPIKGNEELDLRRLINARSASLGLIVPTSLCSGQIAGRIASRLNQFAGGEVSRFITVPHTEGCGVSGGHSETLLLRILTGVLTHPYIRRGLLLEHGCEKTHNDALRNFLTAERIDPSRYGFASIQLDGGIERVEEKVVSWFAGNHPDGTGEVAVPLRIAVYSQRRLSGDSQSLMALIHSVMRSGGSVIVPQHPTVFLHSLERLFSVPLQPTLPFAGQIREEGLHVMECPTETSAEILTGLAAAGAQIIVTLEGENVLTTPIVPVIPVGESGSGQDWVVRAGEELRRFLAATSNAPEMQFQVTRGLTGFSL
ncbi:MAG: UxaA family hydrolase [Verrucomicrobiota bacterium]|nr:UxaA family hydrolase [Verrucomicrobiota bacterium]